jgi:F0F1-type ATP synthase membrane subunit a
LDDRTFYFYTIAFILCLLLLSLIVPLYRKHKINDQIKGLANNTLEMTPKQFMQMRKQSLGGRGKPSYALKKILLVFIYYTIKPRISIMLGRQNRY